MKYALIGCGRISKNHIAACKKNNLEICGLCDIDLSKIESLIQAADLSGQIHRYSDYKELIREEKPDLISIATESGAHAEIAAYCIKHKIHVIVEKPIALNMKDAEKPG